MAVCSERSSWARISTTRPLLLSLIAAESSHRGPRWANRGQWFGGEHREWSGGIHHVSAGHGQHRLDPAYLFLGHREIIGREEREISELPGGDAAFHLLFAAEPGAPDGVEPQGLFTRQPVLRRCELRAANGPACHHPVERDPGIVARDASRIRTGANVKPRIQHLPDGWSVRGSLRAVALREELASVCHAVLNRDPAAQRLDARDV